MKFLGRILVSGFLSCLGLGVVVYLLYPSPVSVDLAVVTRGQLQVTVDEDGRTRIRERFIVSTPLAGQLLRINLHPGDRVEAGKTLLAVIEPGDPALLDARARAEAEARVRAADASAQHAEARIVTARESHELTHHIIERARKLKESNSISQDEFDTAEHRERIAAQEIHNATLAAEVARFEKQLAEAALIHLRSPASGPTAGRFEIRAPTHGLVLRVFQESAAMVPAGTRLLEVGDPADLELEVDVLSADAANIRPGQKVRLEHWGGPKLLSGRVRLVEPSGFTKISALGVEEQRVNVIIDIVEPPEQRPTLRDGYRVETRIVIWERDNVLKVPAAALFRSGDGWATFVANRSRAEKRPITIGRSNGLETEVLDGLSEGDRVIVHPGDRVDHDVRLTPR